MATIERKPLPPLNSRTTPITEADRAEIMARANDVLDYYLNGPGSYFDAGPRKPVELGDAESTVTDLQKFRNRVVAAQQSADDPGMIMQSVVDLIERTIGQVQKAAQDNEGSDRIRREFPETNDRIELPRQKGNPIPDFFPEESQSIRPIAERPSELDPATAVRILARRVASRSSASPFGPTVQPASGDPVSFNGTSLGGDLWHNPNLPARPPEAGRPLGIVSGQPMPDWITPPPIFGQRDRSRAPVDEGREWLMRMIRSVGDY